MPIPDLLPVSEVAQILGVHIRTVHRWVQQGQLDGTKLGTGLRSAYMVTRESVIAMQHRRAA